MGEHEEPWPKDREFLLSNDDEAKWKYVRQEVLSNPLTRDVVDNADDKTRLSIGPKFNFLISNWFHCHRH